MGFQVVSQISERLDEEEEETRQNNPSVKTPGKGVVEMVDG
jgi:hypothetical protein